MKITDIKLAELKRVGPVVIAGSLPPQYLEFILMTVCTDVGIEGHCIEWFDSFNMMAGSLDKLKHAAVGRDPHDVKKITQATTRNFRQVDVPSSILDICLYDILGKYYNTPVYNLLGGKIKDKMPAYVSTNCYNTVDEYVRLAKEAEEKNFIGYKIHTSPSVKLDIEVCEAVRAACPNMHLMLDAVNGYTMKEAIEVGRVLEKLDFEWYESPIPDDDMDGYKVLRHKLDVPLSFGEGIPDFALSLPKYLAHAPADICRALADLRGGISMLERCAHICDGFKVTFDPHSYGPTTVQAAHFHSMLAHEFSSWLELPVDLDVFAVGMKDQLLPDETGYVLAPTKPGLGYELDMDTISDLTIRSV